MPNNIVISSCGKSEDFSANIRTNQSNRWSTEYWLRNLVVQKDFQFKYFITFSFYKAQAHIINQYLENRFIKKVILDFFYPNGRKPKDRMRIWFFNEKEGMFKNVDDFEKEKPQKVKFSLEANYEDKKPSSDKDIKSIVNYGTIVKLITKLVKKKHYNFLETLAEAVFDELFKDKRIAKIMLKIEKLEILKQCSSVGIQITKKRSHDKL